MYVSDARTPMPSLYTKALPVWGVICVKMHVATEHASMHDAYDIMQYEDASMHDAYDIMQYECQYA